METEGKVVFTRGMCELMFGNFKEVNIVFEKKDKTLRTMRCTKNLELIPEEFHPKADAPVKPPSDTVFPIFDLDANGWRSFVIENLKEMKGVQPENETIMPEYQKRVVVERNELVTKRNALKAFIAGDTFSKLPSDEQNRLLRQNVIMAEYVSILNARIEAFQ